MDNLQYRPCVGIILLNKNNDVFVGKRIDTKSEAWQMPQGGIDNNEEAREAALRELEEEVGTDNVTIIKETSSWYYYDIPENIRANLWGGKFIGQRQKWFLMRFNGIDAEINIQTSEPEFSDWKWVNPKTLPNLAVPFKKKLYEDLLKDFIKL